MSAIAGALGVELEKVEYYQLGRGLNHPSVSDLFRARRMLYVTVFLGALVAMLGSYYVQSR